MISSIILASNSGIRYEILKQNGFEVRKIPANIDESMVKESLIYKGASCLEIAKCLAEMKANKISNKYPEEFVVGADQVMELDGENLDKPTDKKQAKSILKKLNNKSHNLHSAVCVSKNGSMVFHFHKSSVLKMKNLTEKDIESHIQNLDNGHMLQYGVYQIENHANSLFEKVDEDKEAIMGLPIQPLKQYFINL